MPENWRDVTRDPRCYHAAYWMLVNQQGQAICMDCLRQYYPEEHDWLTGAEDRRQAAQGGGI